jgi:hypothetical protein
LIGRTFREDQDVLGIGIGVVGIAIGLGLIAVSPGFIPVVVVMAGQDEHRGGERGHHGTGPGFASAIATELRDAGQGVWGAGGDRRPRGCLLGAHHGERRRRVLDRRCRERAAHVRTIPRITVAIRISMLSLS